MMELTLYPGDNGVQEFFECEDSTLAIIRNHGDREKYNDRGWWPHGNHPLRAWYDVQGTLEEVLAGLEEQHDIKATINLTKMWVHPRKDAKNMKLVKAEEKDETCNNCGETTTWHWHPMTTYSVTWCKSCGYLGVRGKGSERRLSRG